MSILRLLSLSFYYILIIEGGSGLCLVVGVSGEPNAVLPT